MKANSATFLYENDLTWEFPAPGIRRQIMGYDENLMIVKVEFEPGADGGGFHSHPHAQSSMILSGAFEMSIGDETKILRQGDGFYAAPDVKHMAKCLEKGAILDAFSPARADFLK